MSKPQKRRARILMVDDELSMLRIACRALEPDYEVIPMQEGLKALHYLGQPGAEVQVALVDLTMPGMNGSTLIKELRQRYPALKIGLLTGMSWEQAEPLLNGEKTDGYLRKPIQLNALREWIAHLMESPG